MTRLRLMTLALTALMLPPLVLGALYLQRQSRAADRRRADTALVRQAESESAELDTYFSEARQLVTLAGGDGSLAPFFSGAQPSRAPLERLLQHIELLYPAAIGEACIIGRINGREYARVVRGAAAAASDLSPDESKSPFFPGAVRTPFRKTYQALPYVSPDTGQWVVSNVSPIRAAGGMPAFLHFEISVESFRLRAARRAGNDGRVEVIDATSGRVIFDSLHPVRGKAALGGGRRIALGAITGATTRLTTIGGRRAAVHAVAGGTGNANHWAVVVTARRASASGGLTGGSAALLGAALLLVLGLGSILFFTRRIVVGVRSSSAFARELAAGDLQHRVEPHGSDELAELGQSLNAVADGLEELTDAAQRVADGDLTVEVLPRSDRDALGRAFSTMVRDLNRLVGHIAASASRLSSASTEVAAASGQIGHAVGDIAGSANEVVSSGADEVVGSARAIASSGVEAAVRAGDAVRSLNAGSEALGDAIGRLGAKSSDIGAIVATISGIAEQTNLLALNATIEAARAGQHGRGFAVVADQVGVLAQESRAAAAEVTALAREIEAETAQTVAMARESAERSASGLRVVGEAHDSLLALGEAVGEVAEVAGATTRAGTTIAAATEQTHASALEIASSAGELQQMAAALDELVGQFTLRASS